MTIYGVDVSSYQADHFPTTVHGKPVSFAIIKATEGTGYTNPRMHAQAAWARSHGMHTGFYHFVRDGDMKKQVAYFVAKAASVEGDSLWLDWEDPAVSGAEKDQFLHELERVRPTHRNGLYCNRDYWLNRDHSAYAADALWIANYTGTPGLAHIQAKWLIHQYNNHDSTSGAKVDVNVAPFADKAAMVKWAAGAKTVTPAPAKKPTAKPKVSTAHVVAAAKADPPAKQGHTTHKAEVLLVEKALHAEGLLSTSYVDGSFGTKTKAAYAALQRHYGYHGNAADGIPGKTSLTKLGKAHGFTVTT